MVFQVLLHATLYAIYCMMEGESYISSPDPDDVDYIISCEDSEPPDALTNAHDTERVGASAAQPLSLPSRLLYIIYIARTASNPVTTFTNPTHN